MQETAREIDPYLWDENPQPGGHTMNPVERPFVLEALVFLERVRTLAQKGLKVTGGPMGKVGEIFDLLDAVCDAFEPEMQKALGLGGVERGR